MRQHHCPVCGAPIDESRLVPRNSWNLVYTFRCQACATMLRWDTFKRTAVATLGAIGMFTMMVGEFLISPMKGSVMAIKHPYLLIGCAATIGLLCRLIPVPLVKHSDE
jgi:hypothetical protein